MSAVLKDVVTVRDGAGVLLRYCPAELRSHHTEQRAQIADRDRMALVSAERELQALQVIAEHLEISDVGTTRIYDALATIRRALGIKRRNLGMASVAVIEES